MEIADEKLVFLPVSELVNLVKSYRQKFEIAEKRLRTVLQEKKDDILTRKTLLESELKASEKMSEVMNEEINKLSEVMTSATDALSKLYGGEKWRRINSDDKYIDVLKKAAKELGDTKELWTVPNKNAGKCIIGGNRWEAILYYWKTYEGPDFKGSIFDYADEAFQDGEKITDESLLDSITDIIDNNNIIEKISDMKLVPV